MYKRVLAVGIALLMALLAVDPPSWAAPPRQQWRAVITYPEPGMTVNGVVEIRGIATHDNFDNYQVRYATGTQVVADTAWVDIVMFVPNQVDNDLLCTWDTTTVPDGPYVLALAVWGIDDPDNPHVHFVEHVTVDNSTLPPTPLPTQAPAATVAAGPTSTPVTVELPATSTPRPTPVPEDEESVATAAPPDDEGDDVAVVLDTDSLRSAFCTGGLVTLLLFLLGGLYVLAKASIRWYLRESSGPRLRE